MKRLTVVLFAACALAACGGDVYWATEPVTCHWIGAVRRSTTSQYDYEAGLYPIPSEGYAQWTNKANWAEGIVPGLIAVPQADGSVLTNGCKGCTAVFGGACTYRVIEFNGFVSVSNILVTGASAPRFIFGHWRWDDPYLRLECGGSFRVDASVPEAPYLLPQLVAYDVPAVAEQTLFTLENNSAGPLDIGYIGFIYPAFPSWVGSETVRYEGTGVIRKRNKTYNSQWGPRLSLAMDGGVYTVASATGAGADNVYYIETSQADPQQHIRIDEGKGMVLEKTGAFSDVKGDLLIDGDGLLRLSEKKAGVGFSAPAGKTLEVDCDVTVDYASPTQIGASGRTGTVLLTGDNDFHGLSICNGGTCEVPRIGLNGTASPVGTEGISIANSGSLFRYTGAGETTDRTLNGSGFGTVEVAGDGDLVWKGPITSPSLDYSYTIATTGKGRFVIATAAVTKFLALAEGTHLGFALPDGESAIALSKVSVGGDVTIDIPSGLTVTFNALTRSAGTCAVNLATGGKLVVAGLTAGTAPAWLVVNGETTYCNAAGEVFTARSLANTREIAAHGAAVPDAPGEAVGITSVGDPAAGDDTLAAADVTVFTLNHEVAEPATVALGADETFSANLIRLKSGAGDLTLGKTAGTGAVKASSGALELATAEAAQTLTVNAKIANAADVPLKPKFQRVPALRVADSALFYEGFRAFRIPKTVPLTGYAANSRRASWLRAA